MPDMVDGFLNELDYQKKVSPNAISTAALQWAHDEIARLRAALEEIAGMGQPPLDAEMSYWQAVHIARQALTPEQQPSDISYAEVSTDDIKRMNEYAKDAAYTPEKRREE